MNLYGQFPSPTNFNYHCEYIEWDQWGVCNDQTVFGPSFCSHFYWSAPDTSLTDAIFEYYKIYNVFNNDTNLIQSLSDTSFTTTTPYEGKLFVMAVYANPAGKSERSNIVTCDGIPISTKEKDYKPEKTIYYNPETQRLRIESARTLKHIRIVNSSGQIIYNGKSIMPGIYIGNLKQGIYIIEITDQFNNTCSDKIIIQ